MDNINVGDILIGRVTGIEKYGVFVSLGKNISGLIHISEITNKFVSNINDYVNMDEEIRVRVIEKGKDSKHLKLSIKNLNYKLMENKSKIVEKGNGFLVLKDKLPEWIDAKMHEISEK